jgi:hypothetical protein
MPAHSRAYSLGSQMQIPPDSLHLFLYNAALAKTESLEFRAEFFKTFNHSTHGVPVLKIFQSSDEHAGNEGSFAAGQDPSAHPNREIQPGMKLVF